MAAIYIGNGDWHVKLLTAIKDSHAGDEIIVDSTSKRELGLRAIKRMCPDKAITVVVQ
jgi:hypothetical protein